MHAGEPDLLNILRFAVIRLAKPIVHERLAFIPCVQPKHPAALIERDRVPKDLYTWITPRVWKLLKAERVKAVGPGHDHARYGVPHAKKLNRRPPYGNDSG